MSVPAELVELIVDLFRPLGEIRTKRMFGGVSFFVGDAAFALMTGDTNTLYVKTDDETKTAHEAEGLGPFRPWPDKPEIMRYHAVPESALDDQDEMLRWARPAVGVALRAAAKRKPRTKRLKP